MTQLTVLHLVCIGLRQSDYCLKDKTYNFCPTKKCEIVTRYLSLTYTKDANNPLDNPVYQKQTILIVHLICNIQCLNR